MSAPFHTQFLGTGRAFPKNRVSNQALAEKVETSDEWIFERTGIRARRVADLSAGETNSDLATLAAQNALAAANLKPTDIDLILVGTVSPDHIMPNTACMVQQKLGAPHAAALDISAACSGFVYGLQLADGLISSGIHKTILLIGSEVLSSIVDWQDRGTCILFGDGAGAVILGRAEKNSKSKIFSTKLCARGDLQDLFFVPGGGSTMPFNEEVLQKRLQFMQMKGKEIFKVAVKIMTDIAVEMLETNGFQLSDLDWLIPHQANLRIIEAVAKRLDFPMEKVIVNLEEFGNTSAASVPTALDEAVRKGKIKRGDLVLMDVFGAGITYGASLARW